MECPRCKVVERVRAHARGVLGLGQRDELDQADRFANVVSGGAQMPDVSRATCKCCSVPAAVTCEW